MKPKSKSKSKQKPKSKSKTKQKPKITTSNLPPESLLLPEPSSTLPPSQTTFAKHWQSTPLIETKNTNNNLLYLPSLHSILSLSNGTLLSLSISSLQITKTFSAPDESIINFTYNSKKNEVICIMNTSMLRIFDYDSTQCTNKFKLHKTIGKVIKIDPSCNFIAIATAQNSIIVYDADTFNIECTFIGHHGIIYDIMFNPISEKFMLYSCSEDNSVKVWNVLLKKNACSLEPHTSSVRHMCLTNDGMFLISGTFDNKIFIWKLIEHFTTENTKPKIYEVKYQFESMMYFTRSINNTNTPSLLLGCDDGSICEFNLQNGDIVDVSQSYINQPIVQMFYMNDIKKVAVLTSEQTLIYLNVNIVYQSIINAEVDKIYPCYCQEVLAVKYIEPGSENFVFASNDNVLKYYDVSNGNVSLYEGHTDFVMSITVKQNVIVTTSKDNTLRIWRFEINKEEHDNEFLCECIGVLKGHSETVNCSDISMKKHKYVVSGCKDGSIKLWDVDMVMENDSECMEINESLYSLLSHEDEVNVVKFSPNEKIIASGAYDKKIKIYSSTNLNTLTTLNGHRRGITDISFSLYAKVLISSSTDKTIKLWNLSDYTCINTFEGHLSSVLKVEWIYYGTHIISAGADGLIKLWNIKTSECINTLDAHEGKIWAMDVNNIENTDKVYFITGGTDAKIMSWKDVTIEKEVELIQAQEDKLNKEDELRHLNYNKKYIEALKLSLELKHKNNFLISFKNYVDDIIKERTCNGNMSNKSDVDLIIENRKIIDKEIEECDYVTKYKECIGEIVSNKEIREIILKYKEEVIEIIRDYNIKQGTFFYAQVLLKILLKIMKMESFYGNGKQEEEGEMLKKKRKRMPKGYIENLEVVKMYSEKHLERINRELTKTYMIDYSIEKMKLV